MCELHKYHRPVPQGVHQHHVIPMAWTIALGIRPSETIAACPTGHDNIHRDLRAAIQGKTWRASGRSREAVLSALAFYRDHTEAKEKLRTLANDLV